MWKKYLGITVDLENREWKVYLDEQTQKKYSISRFAWIADIPDASEMLDVYISEGANNKSNWSSAEFDKFLRGSYGIKDKKKRAKELEKAEKIILDQVPIVPIYHYVFYSLMSPRI